MGLDVSHGCWHGAYSAFMRWREEVMAAAGLPPLCLMEGFYSQAEGNQPWFCLLAQSRPDSIGVFSVKQLEKRLPIGWECLKPSPLHLLLNHSDCDGSLPWQDCKGIADALKALIPNMPEGDGGGHIGNWRDKTSEFVSGLLRAYEAKEDVEFG